MSSRKFLALVAVALCLVAATRSFTPQSPACCPVKITGKPVVNADQTVLIMWDPKTKIQHFVRQASFISESEHFGFLVPTPNEPELSESGNQAFAALADVTAPEVVHRWATRVSCACSKDVRPKTADERKDEVRVLQEKRVAGFDAKVLEATSAGALTAWLRDHGYEFSKAVEAWVAPYVDAGWKVSAFKIAKDRKRMSDRNVEATALRMTFKTDRPLFPYREPEYSSEELQDFRARWRMLRIYFVSDARYGGDLDGKQDWTGTTAWSGQLTADQTQELLANLKLGKEQDADTEESADDRGRLWLTEFEDNWPYKVAPADLYFAKSADQATVIRKPLVFYTWIPIEPLILGGIIALFVLRSVVRSYRRRASH